MAKRKNSTSAKIRAIFEAHPEWVAGDDNKPVVEQFKAENPKKKITKSVMQILYNIKSKLRTGEAGKQHRRKTRKAAIRLVATAGKGSAALSKLEEQIDDCLILAKQIGRESLAAVVSDLHSARNRVVMKIHG